MDKQSEAATQEGITSRRLRVLHIGKYFPPHPGGMETYLRDLMNVQSRQGLEALALVHGTQRSLHDVAERHVEPSGKCYRVIRCARWLTVAFVPICPLFLLSAWRWVRKFRPDVIHIHHPNASAAWLLLLPAARRLPWISTWQSDVLTPDASFAMKLAYWFYEPLERAMLRRSQRVLATSDNYSSHSDPLGKIEAHKLLVLPLGLDTARIPDPIAVTPMNKPPRLVLYVGRLAEYKNLEILVDALILLESAHLWIVGSGATEPAIRRRVIAKNLEARVRFFGSVSENEIWSFYATCDVMCLPSSDKTEAFGMVLLESALFGKPAVAQDIAGSGIGWVARTLGHPAPSTWRSARELAICLDATMTHPTIPCPNGIPQSLQLASQVSKLTDIYFSAQKDHSSSDARW